MTVAIIGGLNRLNEQYEKLAREENLDLRVFNRLTPSLQKRIEQTDGVILFTNLISHKAARHVYKLARNNKINLVCCHKCSVSAVKSCITRLKNKQYDHQPGIKLDDRCETCPCDGCQGCQGGCDCKQ